VRARGRRRSVGSQCALGQRQRSPQELDRILIGLVDRVTRRMRTKGRAGRTVVLRLRFGDFSRATRSRTLSQPTAATGIVLATARVLLRGAAEVIAQRRLTLLGVAVTNLDAGAAGVQLELPLGDPRALALDAALDEVRERFGTHAIARATLLDRGERLAPTLLLGDEHGK
jgi:DNA polymerase-4